MECSLKKSAIVISNRNISSGENSEAAESLKKDIEIISKKYPKIIFGDIFPIENGFDTTSNEVDIHDILNDIRSIIENGSEVSFNSLKFV